MERESSRKILTCSVIANQEDINMQIVMADTGGFEAQGSNDDFSLSDDELLESQ